MVENLREPFANGMVFVYNDGIRIDIDSMEGELAFSGDSRQV
jgi:hypothetical protein